MEYLKSFFLIAVCTLFYASAPAQNYMPLSWIENGMYVDMPLYMDGKEYSVKSIINTGTSFPVIDSTFVVDVLKKDILVGKTLGKNYYHVYIDSICFCGKIIRDVHCRVYELGRFNTGQIFIAGSYVLEDESWFVNRQSETISRLEDDSLKGSLVIP